MPAVGRPGPVQKQNGLPPLPPVSSWPMFNSGTPPTLIGNMQLQHTSVIGFRKVPWHVGLDVEVGVAAMTTLAHAAITAPPTHRSSSRMSVLAQYASSSIRSFLPSCVTSAGTFWMPSLRTM